MGIADVVKKAEEQRAKASVPHAEFYVWLNGLDEVDREALDSALKNGTVSVKTLHGMLREDGSFPFGEGALFHYRKQLLGRFLG